MESVILQTKNVTTLTPQAKLDPTWDQESGTWANAQGTWDQPGSSDIVLPAKNVTTLTPQTKP